MLVYECTPTEKRVCLEGQSKFDEFLGLLEGMLTMFSD